MNRSKFFQYGKRLNYLFMFNAGLRWWQRLALWVWRKKYGRIYPRCTPTGRLNFPVAPMVVHNLVRQSEEAERIRQAFIKNIAKQYPNAMFLHDEIIIPVEPRT